ncbi:MAG TPA: ABC transporter ATP-binding protein [Thermoplasmata archaeon]|nr:ABC transporter ATP-binding protein [Thermoplasmata archaeon]
MSLVSVRKLRVYFKVQNGWVRAVDGVDLDIDEGETVGLVGESGCGKTTLAYAITQLLPSNAYILGGQVFFEGAEVPNPYRSEYWRLAESRLQQPLADLKTRAAQQPPEEAPSAELNPLEEQVAALEHPLSDAYRQHLAPEIEALRKKVDALTARWQANDKTVRRPLLEAQKRLAAAMQEGDLIDITRLKDGRLREYHPKLNSIRWKQISMVFQGAMNALNPVYTVGDQIIEAIQTHEDVDDGEAHQRVEELYRLVGIATDRIDSFPHEYSGGMKQRAMIAMALALNPKLVIMDEPTTALDVITAAKIMDEVLRIQKQLHMTLVIISHDISTVAKVADRICVMYAGQLVEESASKQIFYQTLHPYTQGLLGAFPSVEGDKRRLEAIPGNPPSLVTPPAGCRFHPRCKYVKDICTTTQPSYYVTADKSHRALCHFSSDFETQGGLGRP